MSHWMVKEHGGWDAALYVALPTNQCPARALKFTLRRCAPQALSVASDWRGMMVTAEPEVRIRPLIHAADQFVVLACDGVWDVMTNMEVCNHFLGAGPFSSSGSITRACERLLDLCLGRGSKDNMSVTLIVLDAWWCQQERACCDVS